MEATALNSALNIIATGNPLAIIAIIGVVAVFFVIKYQRKNTGEIRDKQHTEVSLKLESAERKLVEQNEVIEDLQAAVNNLQLQKELMKKDLDHIVTEQLGIKEDIKEIKNTLNSMALALERIAAKYDDKD